MRWINHLSVYQKKEEEEDWNGRKMMRVCKEVSEGGKISGWWNEPREEELHHRARDYLRRQGLPYRMSSQKGDEWGVQQPPNLRSNMKQ